MNTFYTEIKKGNDFIQQLGTVMSPLFEHSAFFSSLHNIQIEPLMTDGVSWRCFYTFLDLDSVIYLKVNGTVTRPPGFHPKYLQMCSEDEQSFTGLERHGGK